MVKLVFFYQSYKDAQLLQYWASLWVRTNVGFVALFSSNRRFFNEIVAFRSQAAWLAQLVECQSAVREVEGSNPRPDQHLGSKNNWGERAAFVKISAND